MVENEKEDSVETSLAGEERSATEGSPEKSQPTPAATTPAVKPAPLPRGTAAAGEEQTRGDISAATLGRLLGLATVGELKLIESKIDLMASKLNNLMVRVDRMTALFNALPSGADLERIDVQLGGLKALIRETLTALAAKEGVEETALKKPSVNIVSSEKKDRETTTAPK